MILRAVVMNAGEISYSQIGRVRPSLLYGTPPGGLSACFEVYAADRTRSELCHSNSAIQLLACIPITAGHHGHTIRVTIDGDLVTIPPLYHF